MRSRDGASRQCGAASITGLGVICVLSVPCSERFFSGFPLSSKTNISKFQFALNYHEASCLEDCASSTLVVYILMNLVTRLLSGDGLQNHAK